MGHQGRQADEASDCRSSADRTRRLHCDAELPKFCALHSRRAPVGKRRRASVSPRDRSTFNSITGTWSLTKNHLVNSLETSLETSLGTWRKTMQTGTYA